MGTSLCPLRSGMSCLNWTTMKTPVTRNHMLIISHKMHLCKFSPKIGCHSNAPLYVVYGSVKDQFPDGTNPISKPNSAWICCIQVKLWQFLWDSLPILAKIWLPWQRPLDPCNQKYLLWIGSPLKPCHRTKKFVNNCYTSVLPFLRYLMLHIFS